MLLPKLFTISLKNICFFNFFFISLQQMNVGDTVEYINDWKKGRQWHLYSLYSPNLCQIVLIRDGKFTTTKHFKQGNYEWTETYLNANIVNLEVDKIKLVN